MYKLSKIIITSSSLIVVLLLAFVLEIEAFNKNKIYSKDKAVIADKNISFIDAEVSQNNNEESDDRDSQNRANINTATNKQNLYFY